MHMPPGCFGSMIAYDHEAVICQTCPAHVACQARVETLRPKVIALLDRYSDGSGREMSNAWLTKGERRARKKALVDGSLVTMNLAAPDARNAPTIKRAARRAIDPRTCAVTDLSRLSKHAGLVVSQISTAPTTRDDLAMHLQERAVLTESSAKRIAAREVSFLISAGRLRYAGAHLELV